MNKFKYKNIKSFYYLKNIILLLVPRIFYRLKLKSELNKLHQYDRQYILSRVNYYNKKKNQFSVSTNALTLKQLRNRHLRILKDYIHSRKDSYPTRMHWKNHSRTYRTYFLDLYRIFSFFQSDKKLDFTFGDINKTPMIPSVVKSRPIVDSENAIIMKLNKVRHFHFINDHRKFTDKKNAAVWRGAGTNSKSRQYFLKNYYRVPIFNIGQKSPFVDEPWFKEFMSIYDQLAYKFIFCIEGYDTATNIKWVMSSHSICVMPKPKYETWFMEGKLEAGVHYIEVNDDFSNAEEKINYYSMHTEEALQIIKNANAYVDQFKDFKREKLISLLVLDKYFSLSGQNQESDNE